MPAIAHGATEGPDQDRSGDRDTYRSAERCRGLAVWLPTSTAMPQGEEGSSRRGLVLWAGLIAAAAVLGWAYPKSRIVATGLVVGPFVTAFWTAPRGDNDGLWTLIFPYLIFIGLVLLLPAWDRGKMPVGMSTRVGPTVMARVSAPPASKMPPSVNMRREHRSTAAPVAALAVVTASLVAVPLALAISGLLLPGDPDDPNVKALGVAVLLVVPVGIVGARRVRGGSNCSLTRSRLHRGARPDYRSGDKCLASSVRLADRHRDSGAGNEGAGTRRSKDPHLYASSAWRMVAAAALLAAVGLFVGWRTSRRWSPADR